MVGTAQCRYGDRYIHGFVIMHAARLLDTRAVRLSVVPELCCFPQKRRQGIAFHTKPAGRSLLGCVIHALSADVSPVVLEPLLDARNTYR